MADTQLTAADLLGFHCSEEFYRHGLVRSILYTEGVKYLAEKAGAYWLIDLIATANMLPAVKREEFQVWTLYRTESKAVLYCEDGGRDGHDSKRIYSKRIPYTDFPLEEIQLYCEFNGEGFTIMLPGER